MSRNKSNRMLDRSVGDRLKIIREKRGMNQTQAGLLLGLKQSSLSEIETGKSSCSIGTIIKAAEVYEVSFEELLGGHTEVPSSPKRFDEDIHIPDELTAEELLQMLAASTGSEEISASAETYINISAYRMFRMLYECNPRNSQAVFSIDSGAAEELSQKLLAGEPHSISAFAKANSKVNLRSIELPAEYSQALRSFIRRCEEKLAAYSQKHGE